MIVPGEKQRAEILSAVSETVRKRFYDPQLRGIDWNAAVEKHRDNVLSATSAEEFESAISALLRELKTSHMGFYHRSLSRATSKMAISATYASFPVNGSESWVFQDVHEGGAAHQAGIRPGEVLVSVDRRAFRPPDHPVFPAGRRLEVTLLSSGGREKTCVVDVAPITDRWSRLPVIGKWKNQLPYAQPRLVTHKRMDQDIGYVRVSMYPGMVGIEVANEVSSAIAALNPVPRLILDLRGNTGGGLAVLRVMSLLTPERLQVGYYLERKQSEEVALKQRFLILGKIPEKKRGLFVLGLKFEVLPRILKRLGQERSVMLRTQGLGPQPFHGRVVVLANRHTASANEMLIAFAKENSLATLVGEATPGRLLAGEKFEIPYDYRLALPVGVYRTAAGTMLEGCPIAPDVEVPFDPGLALEGRDTQLEKAIETVLQL